MARKRWLLTGATGGLGQALQLLFPLRFPEDDLFCLSSKFLVSPDGHIRSCGVSNASEVSDLIYHVKPDIILHCAALSRPLECEESPAYAMQINRDLCRSFALQAKGCSGHMIFCSTDFVFSGHSAGFYSEDDHPEPLNIYGKSKLAGEGELIDIGTGLIARLSLMFDPPTGVENKSWAKLRKQLECHAEVTGVVDEWRTPLSYNSAALILLKLAGAERSGIMHIGGAERLSPFELIAQMKAKIGSRSEILPIQMRQLEQKYTRPRDVSLSTHRLTKWLEKHDPSEMQELLKRSTGG